MVCGATRGSGNYKQQPRDLVHAAVQGTQCAREPMIQRLRQCYINVSTTPLFQPRTSIARSGLQVSRFGPGGTTKRFPRRDQYHFGNGSSRSVRA